MGTILTRALVILALALLAGAAHSWCNAAGERPVRMRLVIDSPAAPPTTESPESPDPAPVQTEPATPDEPITQPAEAEPEPPFISLAQAKELFDRNDGMVIFIDAREPHEIDNHGRVQGSMHLPPSAFSRGHAPRKIFDYLPGMEVVIYCAGGECDASENVAIRLQAHRVEVAAIHILKAGFPAWLEAGYPTETGPDSFPG